MPRAPRIEYENAVYHVMARGNRRMDIVKDDFDRNLFCKTLDEACLKSGWEVFAWVLMSNHYHLVFRTPKPNLVSGMTWFQNTFTRRINTRNGLWGRLFGDRYKAVLVESERDNLSGDRSYHPQAYLATLIDYVHLNPARAGMISLSENEDLLDFRWSSFSTGYAVPPSKRKIWLAVPEGLDALHFRDTASGRRQYAESLGSRISSEESDRLGIEDFKGQSLQSTLQRGWYWGSQQFKESLIHRFQQLSSTVADQGSSRTSRRSEQARDFSIAHAEEILSSGMKELQVTEHDIKNPTRGDLRRAAIAWVIWRRTSGVSHQWIADQLGLRSPANSSEQVRKFGKLERSEVPNRIWEWVDNLRIDT